MCGYGQHLTERALCYVCGLESVTSCWRFSCSRSFTSFRSLRELELTTLADFEFAIALLEAFRDVALRVPKLTATLVSELYAELRQVIARLEVQVSCCQPPRFADLRMYAHPTLPCCLPSLLKTALKSAAIDEKELSAVKAACSKARQTLVEAFVAWIHNAGASSAVSDHLADFLGDTSTKLADPRVYGDVIYVVRQRAAVDSETDVATVVEQCVGLLARALKQLDRYPKVRERTSVSLVASWCDLDSN